jgi:hypothetical protein
MISIRTLPEDFKPQVHFGWREGFDSRKGHVSFYLNARFFLYGFHSFHRWEKTEGFWEKEEKIAAFMGKQSALPSLPLSHSAPLLVE